MLGDALVADLKWIVIVGKFQYRYSRTYLLPTVFRLCIRLNHMCLSVFPSEYKSNKTTKKNWRKENKEWRKRRKTRPVIWTKQKNWENERENESHFRVITKRLKKKPKFGIFLYQGRIFIPIVVVTDEMITHS